MAVLKKIYLDPVDNRKSFYKKCYAEIFGDFVTLYSYDTKIAIYNKVTKELTQTSFWNYSQTTKRHQKAFLTFIESL